jgi:antitoxin PrlF
MYSSSLTSKGQVTIPIELRQLLNLKLGDKVGFTIEDDHIILFKKFNNIEAAFGICKPKQTASLEEIEAAIRSKGSKK